MMLPILELVGDGQEHSIREATEYVSEKFNLSPEDRRALLPSGHQYVVDNRVGWARTYMKKAGLLESSRRGYFNITNAGRKVLDEKPTKIDVEFLQQFPAFNEFRSFRREESDEAASETEHENQTQNRKNRLKMVTKKSAQIWLRRFYLPLKAARRVFLKNESSSCCWRWAMAATLRMQVRPSAKAETVALMG